MNAVAFGSLFQFIRNGMNVKQDKSGDGLPITRIETISDATVDACRVGFAALAEGDCRDWLLEPGDILFSHINSVEHIGKCAVYRGEPKKLVHGMNLLCLRSDTAKLFPEFAKYLIRGSEFRQQLASFINKAVNQASVSIGNLKTIPVTVPSLAEQRRIAEILDKADALRAKRRAALAQLDTLTQSIFLDMFGEPGGKAKQFRSGVLDDSCSFLSGFAWKSDRFSNDPVGLPIIRIQNVDAVSDSECVYWPDTYESRFVMHRGDLLLTLSGSFRIAEWKGPDALLNQRIVRIEAKSGTERLWLLHAIRLLLRKIETLGRHALVNNVALSDLRQLPLARPPIELQRAFGRRIGALEELRTAERAAEAEVNMLFDVLQYRAFQGEL